MDAVDARRGEFYIVTKRQCATCGGKGGATRLGFFACHDCGGTGWIETEITIPKLVKLINAERPR